jgi:ABC-type glutathione transport system ATPase component
VGLLKIENLSVALPRDGDRSYAIEDVNLEVTANEVVCLVGESGSGKSVTAQAIMGLLPPSLKVKSGRITLEQTDLLQLSEKQMRAVRVRRVAMIFQEPMTALNPLMRVGDQIAEIYRYHTRLSRAETNDKVLGLLAAVGLPNPPTIGASYPFRLSGGQRQRVMIASSLALQPSIIIADEPTTALDVTTEAQILALIRKVQTERGMGILYITHDFGVVAEIAHRVIVMRNGRIVEAGPIAQILGAPQHPYTRTLLAAVPHLDPQRRENPAGPVLCTASNLRKTYVTRHRLFASATTVHAVKGISLELRRGETVGLVGESGSGKSTVGRIFVRLAAADSGSVLIDNVDLAKLRGQKLRMHRRKFQMIFQDPHASLNPRRKVGHIIADALRAHRIPRAEADAKTQRLLALVQLDASAADRYPHEFSGGQRQRIGIARALALDPQVLIADEAVSALDVSVQAQVLELLEGLRQQLSLAMLFITHDLRVAAQICDRILAMYRGEIVESGPTTKVFSEPSHAYTRELLNAVPGKDWHLTRSFGSVIAAN